MKRVSRYLLLLALCATASAVYAWEPVDRIAAVVGDKVIAGSELDFQLQLYQVQTGTKVSDANDAHKLKEQILTQMINDRLILIKATQDATIKVVDDEVDEALNSRMDELKSRFPNQEQFEKQVVSEGFTMRELKAKLRDEAREQMLKQKLISKLLNKVSVGKSEVEKFYETYKDSIPPHPQQVKLAHLLLEVTPSKSTSDSLMSLARSLVERINRGDSFEALAQQYSEDASAASGGEIGTVRKGDLMPEFESRSGAAARQCFRCRQNESGISHYQADGAQRRPIRSQTHPVIGQTDGNGQCGGNDIGESDYRPHQEGGRFRRSGQGVFRR